MGGFLEMYIGPMFAGKSTRLIKEASNYVESERILIKHSLDDRYDKDKNNNLYISTHDGTQLPCVAYSNLKAFYIDKYDDIKNDKIKAIFIDEGQFFDDLYDIVISLLTKHNKEIYISGLDGDYKRTPFGDILKLIPEADMINKLRAKCYKCGKPAPFTTRLINIGDKIVVGGADKYQPSCREHHN
jgi:thymidine kinase